MMLGMIGLLLIVFEAVMIAASVSWKQRLAPYALCGGVILLGYWIVSIFYFNVPTIITKMGVNIYLEFFLDCMIVVAGMVGLAVMGIRVAWTAWQVRCATRFGT